MIVQDVWKAFGRCTREHKNFLCVRNFRVSLQTHFALLLLFFNISSGRRTRRLAYFAARAFRAARRCTLDLPRRQRTAGEKQNTNYARSYISFFLFFRRRRRHNIIICKKRKVIKNSNNKNGAAARE